VNWQVPIACGGVAVYPGDEAVMDDEDAAWIPAAVIDLELVSAQQQERLENWIMREAKRGVPLPGLIPPNEGTNVRYESTMMASR
jgi:regulator of RNase E activity RraA